MNDDKDDGDDDLRMTMRMMMYGEHHWKSLSDGHTPVVESESEVVNLSLVLRPCSKGQERHDNLKEVCHLGPPKLKET